MSYSSDNFIFVIHFKVRMKVADSCCVKYKGLQNQGLDRNMIYRKAVDIF